MTKKHEKPTDEEVVQVLQELGSEASARDLLAALMRRDDEYSVGQTQLAIQRVYDRGLIVLGSDWKLRIPEIAAAA